MSLFGRVLAWKLIRPFGPAFLAAGGHGSAMNEIGAAGSLTGRGILVGHLI
jgi:hypothetical protein